MTTTTRPAILVADDDLDKLDGARFAADASEGAPDARWSVLSRAPGFARTPHAYSEDVTTQPANDGATCRVAVKMAAATPHGLEAGHTVRLQLEATGATPLFARGDKRTADGHMSWENTIYVAGLPLDTTVDDMQEPSIFVTYHDAQAYPEYRIRFNQANPARSHPKARQPEPGGYKRNWLEGVDGEEEVQAAPANAMDRLAGMLGRRNSDRVAPAPPPRDRPSRRPLLLGPHRPF